MSKERIYRMVNDSSVSHLDWCGREREVEEIALLLDMPTSTVKHILAKATRTMEGLLDGYLKD